MRELDRAGSHALKGKKPFALSARASEQSKCTRRSSRIYGVRSCFDKLSTNGKGFRCIFEPK